MLKNKLMILIEELKLVGQVLCTSLGVLDSYEDTLPVSFLEANAEYRYNSRCSTIQLLTQNSWPSFCQTRHWTYLAIQYTVLPLVRINIMKSYGLLFLYLLQAVRCEVLLSTLFINLNCLEWMKKFSFWYMNKMTMCCWLYGNLSFIWY